MKTLETYEIVHAVVNILVTISTCVVLYVVLVTKVVNSPTIAKWIITGLILSIIHSNLLLAMDFVGPEGSGKFDLLNWFLGMAGIWIFTILSMIQLETLGIFSVIVPFWTRKKILIGRVILILVQVVLSVPVYSLPFIPAIREANESAYLALERVFLH